MRRGLVIALGLMLGACQAPGATDNSVKDRRGPGTAASRAPASAAPTAPAAPGATAAPRTGPSATSAPLLDLAKLDRLRPPPGATSKLAGTIRVDAAYMVAAGAGNILSHNGAQIVAAGGLNLIGADGASLVAAGAGNLVAAGAGNLVAAGGLNLVAGAGGAIVAAGAGNLVGPDPASYTLTQAAGAPHAGDQLPAAGMLVSVASLTTRTYLPLGHDAKGEAVYAVLSDADGGYELFVPPGEEANLLVIAQPPGLSSARTVFNVFTPREAAAPRVVDEDAVAGTRYLRVCMIARLATVLVSDDPDELAAMFAGETAAMPGIENVLVSFARYYRAIAVAKGIGPQTDPRVVEAMAQAIADAALAMLDIDAIEMSEAVTPGWTGDRSARAINVLAEAMTALRERGAAYLRDPADPTRYLERIDAAFLARVNSPKFGDAPPDDPVPPLRDPARRFLTPAEFPAFVLDEYLAPHRDWVWSPLSNLYTFLEPTPGAAPEASRLAGDAWSAQVQHAAGALAGTLALNLAPLGAGAEAQPGTPAGLAAAAAARAFDPAAAR